MSKTTPVRWWRDDATRYWSRPPYVPPPSPPPQRWYVDLISPPSPGLASMRKMIDMQNWSIISGLGIPSDHLSSRQSMRNIIDDNPTTPEAVAIEREVYAQDPRPGVWAGEPGADLRTLTQEQTDMLIHGELFDSVPFEQLDKLEYALGGPPQMMSVIVDGKTVGVLRQRGGIAVDPMTRVLAYRAWGERDRQWFDLRGVRTGDELGLQNWYAPGPQQRVQKAWSQDSVYAIAMEDGRPGCLIESMIVQSNRHPSGSVVRLRVSDRLRDEPVARPADLDFDASGDPTPEVFGYQEMLRRMAPAPAPVHAPVHAVYSSDMYRVFTEAEIARLLDTGMRSRDVTNLVSGHSQFTYEEVGELVAKVQVERRAPRFHVDDPHAIDWNYASGDPIEDVNNLIGAMRADIRVRNVRNLEQADAIQPATADALAPTFRSGERNVGTKPAPATPPWARERRNRSENLRTRR